MKEIYLDNSATTPLSAAVKTRMCEAMELSGNPSSLHPAGQAAQAVVERARRSIAASLGIRGTLQPGQILFTSCGSEADSLAILGSAFAKPRRRGMKILSTDSEHPAVARPLEALEKQGFPVERIPTKDGVLDLERFEKALDDRVFLVTMMMVNNETGALYDVGRAFSMAKRKNPDIVTHCDAIQGYLKTVFTPQSIKADLVSISAHKIHGPKGVGALYVSGDALRRRDIVPILLGGGQEAGFRSGTENVIGIAGFGAAAEEGYASLREQILRMTQLRNLAENRMAELPVQINCPKEARAPHILHLTLPDIRSETMLHELSRSGICVSAGSACSSHSRVQSPALTAFGLSPSQIESSLRISFSANNTEEEVDALILAMKDAIERLVRIHRG